MAKKGGQVQLQVEINNDDDWAKLLEREGLIVVDIYSDWCGPCSAMSGNLKKIKLEIGGDNLHLAMAKCNHIKDLKRFVDKSEPTWMFIAGGKMVNLVFGANSPKLQQTILDELKKEQLVKDGSRQREVMDITSFSPEEQERYDAIAQIKLEHEAIEAAAREKARAERLEVIVESVAGCPQQHFGFVLVFPYALDRLDQLSEIWDSHKQANSEKVQLKNINIDDLLYYSDHKFSPEVIEQSEMGTCNAYLVKNEDPEVNMDETLAEIVYGDTKTPPGAPESLAERLLTVYIPPPKEEGEHEHEGEDEEEKQEEIMMDGIWVPGDQKTRYLAMFMFFPHVVGSHVPPEPEPTPPHIAVVFDAWKQHDVLMAMSEHEKEVMHLGYFTDEKPDVAKLICKTPGVYARRIAEHGEKMVLQLSKKRSDAVLAFAQIGPTYMSINAEVGAEDCKKFFPEDYGDEDDTSKGPVEKREDLRPPGADEEFVEGMAAGEVIDGQGEDEGGEAFEYGEEGEEGEAGDEGEEGEEGPILGSADFVEPPPSIPEPKAADTQAEPTQAEPAPAEPTPAEPAPTEPAPAEPAQAEPTEAAPTEAEPTESAA